jgi:hypothetical protein
MRTLVLTGIIAVSGLFTQPQAGVVVTYAPSSLQVKTGGSIVVLQTSFKTLTADLRSDSDTSAVNEITIQDLDVPHYVPAAAQPGEENQLTLSTVREAIQVTLIEPKLVGRILAYPSPMRFSMGDGEISYNLNANFEVNMRIYNMFGQLVFSRDYPAASNGGLSGYNHPAFNTSEVGQLLPAGVYFIVLTNEGKLLGKGKFAVAH